jgi:hypothetical protein
MFFRIWFYVCKVATVLFIILFGGLLLNKSIPEAGLLAGATLYFLIPMCAIGVYLRVAISVFGMKMKCPCCRRLGKTGNAGPTLWLECPRCGTVYGNVIRDATLRVEPLERDEEN